MLIMLLALPAAGTLGYVIIEGRSMDNSHKAVSYRETTPLTSASHAFTKVLIPAGIDIMYHCLWSVHQAGLSRQIQEVKNSTTSRPSSQPLHHMASLRIGRNTWR